MRLIDFMKYVVKEVRDAGSITQTNLTVAVFGLSGRGNKQLTDVLFPCTVNAGFIKMAQKGRSKIFTVTDKGLAYLSKQTF